MLQELADPSPPADAVCAESPDALVRVTANARGQILHVELAEGIAHLNGRELSRLLIETSAAACRRAATRTTTDRRGPVDDADETSPAAAEWREAIGAMESGRDGHALSDNAFAGR